MSTITTTETTPPNIEATAAPLVAVVPVAPAPQILSISKSSLDSADRRRDWALWIITLGGMAMTGYALLVLYIVQSHANYAYYLGVLSMVNIFVLFGAIAGLLVKRNINITKNGVIVEDHDNDKQS
jgi:hypothetical protein